MSTIGGFHEQNISYSKKTKGANHFEEETQEISIRSNGTSGVNSNCSSNSTHHAEAAPTIIPASELTYTTLGDGTVEITRYTGVGGDVEIPSTLGGKQVSKIGDSVFSTKNLSSLIIPEGVTTIGNSAFSRNQIKSVTVPKTVTSMGTYAFSNNQLETVIVEEGVKSIGKYTFRDNKITSLTIPKSVTTIGEYAFENNKLTELIIPEGVKTIGMLAFSGNTLTSLTLPESLTTLEDYAFAVNQLESISIPKGLKSIGTSVFSYNKLETLEIPEWVTNVGPSAFLNNQLTQVKIPNSGTTIKTDAFKGNQVNPANLTIYGLDPSTAKTYAAANFHTFKPLSEWVDTTQPETEPIKTKSKWVTIVPSITVTGGKPVNAITIKGVEWETSETITTDLGKITLSPDREGNTIINIPDGLGTTATDETIRVEVAEETFLDIIVKTKPVITFSF